MRLRYVIEDEPLGTAGPVRLALRRGPARGAAAGAERRRAHRHRPDRRARAARAHGRARDARALSRSRTRPATGSCRRPRTARSSSSSRRAAGEAPTNRINAGAYVIERDVVESIPAGRAVSFEREVFPALVGQRAVRLRRRRATGSTSGRPSATSRPPGTCSPGGVRSTLPPRDETGSLVYEDCLLAGAHVGPQSVLGPPLLGGHGRARRALGAPRPRARGRGRRGDRVRARRGRAGGRARAGGAGCDGGGRTP